MSQSGQDVLDVINSSSRSIADKCQIIDRYLSGNSDNLRGFFENCFPVLVKCIFGYDRAGWLSDIAKVAMTRCTDQPNPYSVLRPHE